MPRMLSDILENVVATQPDMFVLKAGAGELRAEIEQAQPHVLIVGFDAGRTCDDDLLYAFPRLKVLAVASSGRDAFLCELQPRQHPIEDVSPDGLVQAIRDALVPVA